MIAADLAPRDRSLVTVSALIASGQVAQIPYHLNRAMDNGLTREQAGEVLTHLAFYVGWPNVFSALPVAKYAAAMRRATSSLVSQRLLLSPDAEQLMQQAESEGVRLAP